jgi:CubicO group peptidase (beta-lactamase class C family)
MQTVGRLALFLACAASGAGALPVGAADAPRVIAVAPADVQRALDAWVVQHPGTGIVAGIVDEAGTHVYRAGTSGTPRPLDEHTLFEIGSVTKTFTATILASMVLDRIVSLDDPVAKYLPSDVHVPERNGLPITLLSLATQHSGLPRMPDNLDMRNPADPYADYRSADLYRFVGGYTLPRDPGASFEYSNLGVGLLGDALAYRAGTSYEALVRTRVFDPLGMRESSSLPVDQLSPALRAQVAVGHDADGAAVPPWNFGALAPAGAVRSSVADMLAYVRCNMGDGPLAKACLFAQQPRATLPGSHIGLVWWTGDVVPVVHHGGDTFGFHASVAIAPDRSRGVVVLANGGGGVEGLAEHLADATIPLTASRPEETITLAPGALDAYAGTYQSTDGMRYVMQRDAAGLRAKLANQEFARVYPVATDRFAYRVVAAELTFTRDAQGTINGVVLAQDGERTLFARDGARVAPTLPPAAALSTAPTIAVDAATLGQYVGTYLIDAGTSFTVTRAEDQLLVRLTGQDAFPVYASVKDRFFYKVVDAQIDFQRDASGRVTTLVLHQNGRDLSAQRR